MSFVLAAALALTAGLGCHAAVHPMKEETDHWSRARDTMVADQIAARGVHDPAVLRAMRTVPRHEFVLSPMREHAYEDRALPIGHDQTISQPYIVAFMSELAAPGRGARVLEVGTGSGYQAAILAEMGADVYSIEIVAPLAEAAQAVLVRTGYERVHLRTGDGRRGWPEAAPFEVIVVTAAATSAPPALLEQLAPNGRLIIPVGDEEEYLEVHRRTANGGVTVERVLPVRFVPLVGAN